MKGKYIEALDRECLRIHPEITDARRPLYQVNESLSFIIYCSVLMEGVLDVILYSKLLLVLANSTSPRPIWILVHQVQVN